MLEVPKYLEYSDGEHRYFADGIELISVTQILDLAGKVSPYCRDEEARYRGTKVHELCAQDDVEWLDFRTVPAEYRGYIKAWRNYVRDAGFRAQLIEQRLDCLDYGYSGRVDRIGTRLSLETYKPQEVIIDIKTSKGGSVPDYARLQLAAYAYAYDRNRLFERIAVSLRPDGRYNCKVYPTTQFYMDKIEFLTLAKNVKEQLLNVGRAEATNPN